MLTLAALALLAVPRAAVANDSLGYLLIGQGGAMHSIKSVRERRFDGIVQQQTDFSCGAAVIATLFRDGYGAPVGESDVLRGMFNITDPATVRSRGFSLLDIKRYARLVGLGAEGYDLTLEQLADLRVPAVVLLNLGGYHHFAILRKADARYAYLADPALGYLRLPLAEFAAEWNDVALVILGPGYQPDNELTRVTRPLDALALYGTAPIAPTPQAEAVIRFDGVPPVQRI
ncbi:MAG: C39 family peptidase [Vulcanimicrobiaceae bacterium]